jgi:signal transduction histidine kinase
MHLELWLGAAAVLASLLALGLHGRLRALQRAVQRAHAQQLDALVRQRTLQLTELTHHLQTAREDERSRLARNLHDDLGALLTSAKLDAARIRPRLAGAPPEALERLAHLVEMLNGAIALGRRIIEDLRPSTLNNLGLAATLEILAREFAERSGVEVHCTLTPAPLEASAELVVYRLVQEAVTNISKYAAARHVWLDMAPRGRQVEVRVRDDGVGFDPAVQRGSAYGLVGMRYRVEAVQGTLEVLSAPGQGTVLRVRLPGLSVASYAA